MFIKEFHLTHASPSGFGLTLFKYNLYFCNNNIEKINMYMRCMLMGNSNGGHVGTNIAECVAWVKKSRRHALYKTSLTFSRTKNITITHIFMLGALLNL